MDRLSSQKSFSSSWKQNGYALIVMVFFAAMIALIAVLEPVIFTSTAIQEINLGFDLMNAEQKAVSGTSKVREAIDRALYQRIQKYLSEHIQKYMAAQDSEARGGYSTFDCQGIVSADTPITAQWSLCEPWRIMEDEQTGYRIPDGKNQTIDQLSVLKQVLINEQTSNPKERKKLLETVEWREIERQSFNRFD